jgi:DNA-binding HxlR family transcriptional regulator
MKYNEVESPIRKFIEILGGKWRMLIIEKLVEKNLRFTELEEKIEGISPRMLTKELRALFHFGILEKETFKEMPPKVEYSLSDFGVKLIPLIDNIKVFGDHLTTFESDPESFSSAQLVIVNENEMPLEVEVPKVKKEKRVFEFIPPVPKPIVEEPEVKPEVNPETKIEAKSDLFESAKEETKEVLKKEPVKKEKKTPPPPPESQQLSLF